MYPKSLVTAGFVSAALLAGPALAADMPVPEPTPPAPAPAPAPVYYDWSGVYGGVHGGYAWGDRDLSLTNVPPAVTSFSYDSDGWLLGGQLGVNWQVDNWVLGVEGDIAWSGVDGSMTLGTPPLPGGWAAHESHDMKWLSTLRARVGFAADSILFYGTGGIAFAEYDSTAWFAPPAGPNFVASDSNTHTGWTLGAGIEAGLTENLSLKAEYLYVDFGSKNYTYAFAPPAPVTTVSADHQHHIVRAGLNYRFNW
jgi:outer membrane immunogenic protein